MEEEQTQGKEPKEAAAVVSGHTIYSSAMSDEEKIKTALFLAMDEEIHSLQYAMTAKRRSLAHKFILDCYKELMKNSCKGI